MKTNFFGYAQPLTIRRDWINVYKSDLKNVPFINEQEKIVQHFHTSFSSPVGLMADIYRVLENAE